MPCRRLTPLGADVTYKAFLSADEWVFWSLGG